MLRAGKIKTVFKDLIGIAESAFDLAALVTKMETDIAPIVDNVLAAPAIAGIFASFECLMHERRIFCERLFDGVDGGQLFVIDVDQFHRRGGAAGIYSRNCGHHISDVANFFAGKNLLVSDVSAKGAASKI